MSKKNPCQPGDLAYVNWSRTPGFQGRLVVVVRPATEHEMARSYTLGPESFTWIVRSAETGGTLPQTEKNRVTGQTVICMVPQRMAMDDHLTPIRPQPDTEDTDTKQNLKEPA